MGGCGAVEIKTLFVVNPENNRGCSFGAKLFTKTLE